MSRLLHWMLLGGCAALSALFSPLAWQSVLACEVPADCRASLGVSEVASVASEEAPADEQRASVHPVVGTIVLGAELGAGPAH